MRRGREEEAREGGPRVAKLEDGGLEGWNASSELGGEGFKRIMRRELRKCVRPRARARRVCALVRVCVCVCVCVCVYA